MFYYGDFIGITFHIGQKMSTKVFHAAFYKKFTYRTSTVGGYASENFI